MAKQIMGPENDPFYELRQQVDNDMSAQMHGAAVPKPKGNSAVSGFFGVLALLCFIGTFAMGFLSDVVLPDGMGWVLVAMFGATFLNFGICMFSSGVKPGLLFALIGLLVSLVSAGYGLGGDALREVLMGRAVPAILLSCFAIIGLCLMAIPPVLNKKRAALHPVEINATVIDKHLQVSRDHDGHLSRTYTLDWEYYAGGRKRIYKSRTGRSPERREPGDAGVLYLSETDPDDVWEKPAGMEKALMFTLGAIFFIAGVFTLAMFFGFFR